MLYASYNGKRMFAALSHPSVHLHSSLLLHLCFQRWWGCLIHWSLLRLELGPWCIVTDIYMIDWWELFEKFFLLCVAFGGNDSSTWVMSSKSIDRYLKVRRGLHNGEVVILQGVDTLSIHDSDRLSLCRHPLHLEFCMDDGRCMKAKLKKCWSNVILWEREFSCVHCDVIWLGPENYCTKASNGNHQWKHKLVDVDDDKVGLHYTLYLISI